MVSIRFSVRYLVYVFYPPPVLRGGKRGRGMGDLSMSKRRNARYRVAAPAHKYQTKIMEVAKYQITEYPTRKISSHQLSNAQNMDVPNV